MQVQQKFHLDFVNNTVEIIEEPLVLPAFVERNPGEVTAELLLTLRIAPEGINQPGNVGRRHIFAKVTNRSSGAMGTTDSSAASAIELNFIATQFRDRNGAAVPGGGYAREDAFDAHYGTPIYYFSTLYPGQTSGDKQVDMWLPPTATDAEVTAILRCHSERFNPVSLNRWWVSTLAGEMGHYGMVDSVAWEALLGRPALLEGLVFRENAGDVVFTDAANNRVRMLTANPVTRKPEVFTVAGTGSPGVCSEPMDLAIDPLGNVYASEYGAHCISMFTPSVTLIPTLYTIAGLRNSAGDAVGTGAAARFSRPLGLGMAYSGLYVCDQNGSKIKMITTKQVGSIWASDYTVTNVPTAGLQRPTDIAADKLGNLYVSDRGARRIFIRLRRTNTWFPIAGSGEAGDADGQGNVAQFRSPGSIDVDAGGIVWVADNGRLRRIRWKGGDMTVRASWQVETIPFQVGDADGFAGAGASRNIRGLCVTRGGVVGLWDDGALRRLDLTRN